jgi:nucleoside-diphosphate kinase
MERTLLMIKPDGLQRGLAGEIIKRFEQKGFQMVGCKLLHMTAEQAAFHYAEHDGRPYYPKLVSFITSGPVLAMVWEADEVIALSRKLIGKTEALDMIPGTIRGDFAHHTNFNLIHGSDSPDNALREIGNLFRPEELLSYTREISKWL